MERRFDAIVLIPLTLIVGFALGIVVAGGNVPTDEINRAISLLVGAYIALIVIELVVRMVSDAIMSALFNEPEAEPAEGAPGELTVLLVRDGDVVGEVKSWDKPMERGKRDYWAKKLGRLFARRKPVHEADH